MEFDKVIKERHSVRRFSTKKVDWENIIEAIDSANSAPLAGNIPVFKFILVDDKTKIQRLADASQQDFVSDVNYVIVICSVPDQLLRSYNERGKTYARQQAGAAIENFLLKITDMNLASCWVGAFVDDQVRNILSIPDNVEVEAILPVGYEMPAKGKQQFKPDLNNALYFNKWKEKYMVPRKKVEAL